MRNRLVVTNIAVKKFGGFAISQKTTKKPHAQHKPVPKLSQDCD